MGRHIFPKAKVTSKNNALRTPFLGTVFNTLSHGVIPNVQSVTLKTLKLEASDWLLKNFNQ